MSAYEDCPACDAPTIWVPLNGKHARIDRTPNDQGELWIWHHASDAWEARYAVPGEQPGPQWKRYAIHPASCAPPDAPPGVTQLDTWRKAQSAHNAAQRRTRWRSASVQNYLGYRRPT